MFTRFGLQTPTFGTWPPVPSALPLPIPAWGMSQRGTTIAVNIAAAAFGELPGPPVGFVRLYDVIAITPAVNGAAIATISTALQPLGWNLAAIFAGANASLFLASLALGAGEAVRFTNGGANAAIVSSTYYDVPAELWTLVRLQLTAAAQTLIPVPAAGFTRKLARYAYFQGGSTLALQMARFLFNADTVPHSVETLLNGVIVGRSAAAATLVALNPGNAPIAGDVTATSGALAMRLTEAVVTTPPTCLAAYWTLRD